MTIADILTDRIVEDFTIGEHGISTIVLTGGVSLTQESLLRYIGQSGVFISAEDHGHQFGLQTPYDAETEIRDRIVGKSVQHVEVTKETGDLILTFDEGRIEIICTSAAYEAYQIHGPDNLIIVGRGGLTEVSEQSAAPNSLGLGSHL